MPNVIDTANTQATNSPEGALATLLQGLVGVVQKSNPGLLSTLLAETTLSNAITADLAKAHKHLEGHGFNQVVDQWDGAPDDKLPLVRVTRQDVAETVSAVPVGPVHASWGGGAAALVRQSSDIAPGQPGVTEATTRLGKQLNSVVTAVKSLISVAQTQQIALNTIQSSLTNINSQITDITKSKNATIVIAKTEESKKEDKQEQEERDKEVEDEKAASFLRPRAESLLNVARVLVNKAQAAKAASDEKGAEKLAEDAEKEVEKARTIVLAAHELNPNSKVHTPALFKSLNELATEITTIRKSSNSPVTQVVDVAKTNVPQVPSQHSIDEITKALSGLGTLTTTLQQLMTTVAGQSRNPTGLPPVFDIAKANTDNIAYINEEVKKLWNNGDLTDNEADQAFEAINRVKAWKAGSLPQHVAQKSIEHVAPAVRALLQAAA